MHRSEPCGTTIPDRLSRLAKLATEELQANILPFWLGLADTDNGGFYGKAFSRTEVLRDAPKCATLQCRILWTFSAAYEFSAQAELLAASEQAFDFIAKYLLDPRSGGAFWSVSFDGRPLDTEKHLYVQAFAIYALATFYRATRRGEALELAIELWRTLEARATDDRRMGYRESFDQNWASLPNSKMGMPAAISTLNAHLHLLEGLQALWEVWPDPHLQERLLSLIGLLIDHLLDRRRNTFFQYFTVDWYPLDIGLSLGHDVEACWLINKAAASLGPSLAGRTADALEPVVLQVMDIGMGSNGGVRSGRRSGGRWSRKQWWWVQAEALVGFLDAYERSGKVHFLIAAERVWNFVSGRIIDRECEEWRQLPSFPSFWSPRLPKADAWKCPYHNGRACIEIAKRSLRLAADARRPIA